VEYRAPLEQHFNKKTSANDGFQYVCKSCMSKHRKKHYRQNRQYYIEKATQRYLAIKARKALGPSITADFLLELE